MKFLHVLALSLIPSAFAEDAGRYVLDDPSPLSALIQLFAPLIISCVLFGVVCHLIAKKKGYPGYFWTGFFLLLIGAVYVAALPVVQNTDANARFDLSPEDKKLLASFHRLASEDQKSILSHIHSFLIEK